MIHDELVTYEVAKLAKEKGFDVDCEAFYYDDGFLQYARFENWNGRYLNKFSAPTQSLLQRWLREEKGIHISVEYEWVEGVDDWTFWSYIKKINNAKVVNDAIKSGFNTYELALEDALKYALEKLV